MILPVGLEEKAYCTWRELANISVQETATALFPLGSHLETRFLSSLNGEPAAQKIFYWCAHNELLAEMFTIVSGPALEIAENLPQAKKRGHEP